MKVSGKGYVKLCTSHGEWTVQLHCDMAPLSCAEFLAFVKSGTFDKTECSKLVPNFLVQFGISARLAAEKERSFPSETNKHLKHDSVGVVSAIDGTDQFFITLGKCPHLDNPHNTIIGMTVGDLAELAKLNNVPVDLSSDRPKEKIIIKTVEVFEDPFSGLPVDTSSSTLCVATARPGMQIGKYMQWPSEVVGDRVVKKSKATPWSFAEW